MPQIETPYGTADIRPHGVTISATNAQLWAWAHRPGAHWPASVMANACDEIRAHVDANGLVDLTQDPAPSDGDDEIPGDEFSAWSADVLRAANLPQSHPAYPVNLGQFLEV